MAFGLYEDRHHTRIPSERLVSATPRADVWMLLQCGALTEGALTELKWGEKGCRLHRHGADLFIDGNSILLVWDEPMEGVDRPWFECPLCKQRCRHLYLRDPIGCRRCCRLDYASRHLRRQTPAVGRVERLRRKAGGCDTRPFAPLPARPPGRSEAFHAKLVAKIHSEEQALVEHLGGIVDDLQRRIRVRRARHKW